VNSRKTTKKDIGCSGRGISRWDYWGFLLFAENLNLLGIRGMIYWTLENLKL
jgi:hypothetical protein